MLYIKKKMNESNGFGTFSRWISIVVHLLSFLLPGANNANDDQNEKNTPYPKHCSNYCLVAIVIVVI